MDLTDYSCQRLNAVLTEIESIYDSEFPYSHSKDGLALIRDYLSNRLKLLQSLAPGKNVAIVKGLCAEALSDLFRYLPLLGFILRSTNVRNAFEVYGPILSIAKLILGINCKLILSSEWLYSPLTYRSVPVLPNYVLIGFPASESANPLLLPLAGHELGHSVWQVRSLSKKYAKIIEDTIINKIEGNIGAYQGLFPSHNLKVGEASINIFVKQTIAVPSVWALKQAEEYFCDFLGLSLFGEAYLHAFAYLVAPSAAGERSQFYPNSLNRVAKLIEASARFKAISGSGFEVPEHYDELFQNQTEPSDTVKRYCLSLADAASATITGQLMAEVEGIVSSSGIKFMDEKEKSRVLEIFRFVIPATSTDLSTILNAAWSVYHDSGFWNNMPKASKISVLKELILKNVEVLEIEAITSQP